jgi:hypothetical protein
MLAHTRADVAELNQLARSRMREAGDLGEDLVLPTERGERTFAAGDRLMFLRNERSLAVKNGTLGTVQQIDGAGLTVRLDGRDRRDVRFDLKDYAAIDHGYASTIHKSQGVTVDRAHLLATDGLDRHAAYVGMSRHRETLSIHYGADDFRDGAQLVRTLGRERAKDTTLDYSEVFAERRGFAPTDGRRAPFKFAGFRPRAAGERLGVGPIQRQDLSDAARGYARAFADAERMRAQGLPVLPHQDLALARAQRALEAAEPEHAVDLRSALARQRGLAAKIDQPGGTDVIARAVAREGALRRSPELRAEAFEESWTRLRTRHAALGGIGNTHERRSVEARLQRLAGELSKDPQVETLVARSRKELGIAKPGGRLAQDLVRLLSVGRGIGR